MSLVQANREVYKLLKDGVKNRGVDLDAILKAEGFQKVAFLDDAQSAASGVNL